MPFEKLAACLERESPSMLQRWRDEVRADPSQPACRHGLEGEELDDHLPSLLRILVRCLRDQESPELEREGAEHGRQRRSHGYTVEELFDEMLLFRRIVTESLEACGDAAGLTTADLRSARRLLIDLVDVSLKASVGRFILDAEGERNDAFARLAEKNAELDEANAHKDRFLAVLSHELRSPLSSILASTRVAQHVLGGEAPVSRQIAIIDRQARHVAKLVDDLLDVSRISVGKIRIDSKEVDLRTAVRAAVETCRPAVDAKAQPLEIAIADEQLHVMADETRIAQIVVNLLSNASKFTPAGASVGVELVRDGDHAVLRVRDSGIGIAPEMLPRVFDAFQQAAEDRTGGGLGIGLTLAKSLVEMHGGRIEALSDGVGKGAEIVVRLPLVGRTGA